MEFLYNIDVARILSIVPSAIICMLALLAVRRHHNGYRWVLGSIALIFGASCAWGLTKALGMDGVVVAKAAWVYTVSQFVLIASFCYLRHKPVI